MTQVSQTEYDALKKEQDYAHNTWGDKFDATYCKNSRSRPGEAHPEPVGAYAEDTSPYGVCDLAGGVREWCETPATSKGADVRHLRGGSWLHGSTAARCCSRMGDMTDAALYIYGFRLCTTELLAV